MLNIEAENLKNFYKYLEPYLQVKDKNKGVSYFPVGIVVPYMGNIAPKNFLACDGHVVNVRDYPELAQHFLDQFGAVNYFGGTTEEFNVPDLRGEFLRGTGTNSHAEQGSGAAVGTHQDSTEINYGWVNNAAGGWSTLITPSSTYRVDHLLVNPDYTMTFARKSYVIPAIGLRSNTASNAYRATLKPTCTGVLWCISARTFFVDCVMYQNVREQQVGFWYDGKPLYRQCFEYGAASASSVVEVGTISDYSEGCIVEGYGINTNANFGAVGEYFPLTICGRNVDTQTYSMYGYITPSGTVNVAFGSTASVSKLVVHCVYTKTTD